MGTSSEYVEALHQIEAAQETDALERALDAARERLHMDAAYITTISPTHQTIDAVVGDRDVVGKMQGRTVPVEQTYCMRMLNGEMPHVVPDTSREPAVQGLPATQFIGAYMGVPVTLSDGRIHGTLCCASRSPRDDLGEEELHFLEVLAGMVSVRVERAHGNVEKLTERIRARYQG